MHIKGLFAFAVVALAGMTNAETDDHFTRELQLTGSSEKFLSALNTKRIEKNLAAVCVNTKLAQAAQVLADDNAKNNKVSTTVSDGSTQTTRYTNAGIETTGSAMFVAAGQTSVDAVLDTWSKSKLSESLYSNFTFIGLGYTYDETKLYKHYWVLDLANAPKESCGSP